jgi:primosomal protein N'
LPGRVLIQTYYPEHYALRHAVKQDYEGFYNEEIRFRQQLSYPPFVVLASILVKSKDEPTAARNAGMIKSSLDAANVDKKCRIIGVAPASTFPAKGRVPDADPCEVDEPSGAAGNCRDWSPSRRRERSRHAACVHEIDPVNLM